MPPPPITIEITAFARIEILRAELEKLQNDLKETERQIREVLYEQERRRYLETIHPLYQRAPPLASPENLPKLNATRDDLCGCIQALQAALSALEVRTLGSAAATQVVPATGSVAAGASSSALRRQRFESFEDFRAKKQNEEKG